MSAICEECCICIIVVNHKSAYMKSALVSNLLLKMKLIYVCSSIKKHICHKRNETVAGNGGIT